MCSLVIYCVHTLEPRLWYCCWVHTALPALYTLDQRKSAGTRFTFFSCLRVWCGADVITLPIRGRWSTGHSVVLLTTFIGKFLFKVNEIPGVRPSGIKTVQSEVLIVNTLCNHQHYYNIQLNNSRAVLVWVAEVWNVTLIYWKRM